MGTPASMLEKIVDAYSKSQESQLKLKTEIVKQKLRQNMLRQNTEARQNARFQTPEQQYLRRRAMEENPLAQMAIPTEDNPTQEVEFPAEMPPAMGNQGLYQQPKATSEDQKNRFFLTKLNRMIEAANRGEGRMPSPLALKIGEKMKARLNQRLGYKMETPETGQRKASEWKAYITMLQKKAELDDLSSDEENKLAYAQKKYDELMFGVLPERSTQGIGMPAGEAESGQETIRQSKYTLGQTITAPNGKQYRITGLDDPEDPDVEEV